VPKEALYLGLAGVTPYLATSSGTVFLAWEMNNAFATGSGHYISGETAELLMRVLEPVQVGYGAVVRKKSIQFRNKSYIAVSI
jgi:hypothetical protein